MVDTMAALRDGRQFGRRAFLSGAAALLAGSALAVPGPTGLALIMVDEPGCRYCRKFDAEIGGRYAKSAEGRFAPLVKVRRKSPELSGYNPVIYTPTFILVRRGTEVARITGYPGPDYFYSELDQILAPAGFVPGLGGGASAI